MTYRGHIHNGVVVLDERPDLPDGTPVSVQPLDGANRSPGTPQSVLEVAGTWRGEAGELDRLFEELRKDKWAEVGAKISRPLCGEPAAVSPLKCSGEKFNRFAATGKRKARIMRG